VFGAVLAPVGFFFLASLSVSQVSLGVLFAIAVLIERAVTELLKGYLRNEPQDKYKIPSTVHLLGRVVKGGGKRVILGALATAVFIALTLLMFSLDMEGLGRPAVGAVFGFLGGLLIAVGGGLKDAPIEGFDCGKFFRSPLVAMLSGLLLSFFAGNPGVLMLASMGGERMVTEAYKTFVKKSVPGKFRAAAPSYPDWTRRRMALVLPYAATWIVFALSLSSSIRL
ncbi:MAG: hypothetical protein PHG85_00390, partial [Candidatus Altiarchaeota archaeon]|nr:hypothetical protein [Candidatus Altiarchaeota archaeon]